MSSMFLPGKRKEVDQDNVASHGAEKPGLYIAGASRLSPLGSALLPSGLMGRATAQPALLPFYVSGLPGATIAGQAPRD